MYGITFPMSAEAMSDNFLLPIGKAKVEREGSDVTIVAHSKMVTHSLEAADELAKEGYISEKEGWHGYFTRALLQVLRDGAYGGKSLTNIGAEVGRRIPRYKGRRVQNPLVIGDRQSSKLWYPPEPSMLGRIKSFLGRY